MTEGSEPASGPAKEPTGQAAKGPAREPAGEAAREAGAPEGAPAKTRRTRHRPADRAFLPAALEIVDTPPSPVSTALLLAICALAAAALAWSWIGRVDVMAIASGKIQPAGRVKVVEPLETGRVELLAVSDGQAVKAGDLLMRLDPREVEADVAALTAALASFRAEAVRRRAALAAAREGAIPPLAWEASAPTAVREREATVLKGDVDRLHTQLAMLDAQEVQKRAEQGRLRATIDAQRTLLATQDQRVGMRTELMHREVGSKAQLLDAQEVRQSQEVNLRVQEGQLAEAIAAIDVIDRNRTNVKATFVAENAQRLADIERQVEDTRERLAKARARLDHMTITAPISGTVTAMSVIGAGQVVTTGDEVLRIVPAGSRLELEVYMPNQDMGFIHEGADVTVKVDSFPFTRFGTLSGRVVRVASDAVAEPDVNQSMAAPATSPRTRAAGGTQRMQNLVFPVTVALDRQHFVIDGASVPLSPGMTAQAEVKTGERRILEFLFSPLVDVGSSAMRER